MDAPNLQIMRLARAQIEGVTACEVSQHHQVAEWLHNVPTQVVERAEDNEGELTDHDQRAEEADDVCVSGRVFSELVYLLLVWSEFALELRQSRC